MNILDIGSNDGFWYKMNKDLYPGSKFTLIEANALNEPELKKLGVEYYIECLSDYEKEVSFYITKKNPTTTGASYYKEDSDHFSDDEVEIIKMKTKRLDDLFPDRSFDVIKIDVQGSELDIINGGKRIFSLAKKVIMEVPIDGINYNIGAPKRKDYFDKMNELGFIIRSSIGVVNDIHEDFIFEK
jgi:FkbM family methyltransferase